MKNINSIMDSADRFVSKAVRSTNPIVDNGITNGISRYAQSNTGMNYLRTGRGMKTLISDGTYPRYFFDGLQGKNVLDVGTGFGDFVLDMKKLGAKATGIDIYPSKNFDLHPESFKVADAADTGLPEKSFDYVYSSYSVLYYHENIDFKEKVLREMKRVLKDDGRIRLGTVNLREISELAAKIGGLKVTGSHKDLGQFESWVELAKMK